MQIHIHSLHFSDRARKVIWDKHPFPETLSTLFKEFYPRKHSLQDINWTFQKQLVVDKLFGRHLVSDAPWQDDRRTGVDRGWLCHTHTDSCSVCMCYIWLQLVFVWTTSVCLCMWVNISASLSVYLCMCIHFHLCVCVRMQLSWSSQVGVSWRHCQAGLISSFPIRGSIPVTQLTPRVALPCHFATRIKVKTSWK